MHGRGLNLCMSLYVNPLLYTEAQGSLLSVWSKHRGVAHVRHLSVGVSPWVSRTPSVGGTPGVVELSTVQGTRYVYSSTGVFTHMQRGSYKPFLDMVDTIQ